jgi:hypothetical protein
MMDMLSSKKPTRFQNHLDGQVRSVIPSSKNRALLTENNGPVKRNMHPHIWPELQKNVIAGWRMD